MVPGINRQQTKQKKFNLKIFKIFLHLQSKERESKEREKDIQSPVYQKEKIKFLNTVAIINTK